MGGDGEIIILHSNSGNRVKYSLEGGRTWKELYLDIPVPGWSKTFKSHSNSSRRFILKSGKYYYLISFDPADQESDSDIQLSNEYAHKL